ncbi:MAG: transferase [Desulfovibrio sp.]
MQLERLIDHIITRVNINLRNPRADVRPYVSGLVEEDKFSQYYAFYALTPHHPLYFRFRYSSLAGTYFLGKCEVENSVLYKSDIRGDELKSRGTTVKVGNSDVRVFEDEIISIRSSILLKTLVHNHSHDPESLEVFRIRNTVALHFSNIHGTCIEGLLLMPFATVDLSTVHDCVVGNFSYVQAGELSHEHIGDGLVWVRAENAFEFKYQHPQEALKKYVDYTPGQTPRGEFMTFLDERKEDFMPVYASVLPDPIENIPETALVSPYAVVKGDCRIGENVLVAQRAYVENSRFGDGGNAQENCYIVNSVLDGMDVTAHGGKIIHCHVGQKVFTGFNSFLRGSKACPVKVGSESIIMPHTIIDAAEPIEIPAGSLVWGLITCNKDLETHCISLEEFAKLKGQFRLGNMSFEGSGRLFVDGFRHRIEHILEENGAYFDSDDTRGHAQTTQGSSYSLLQPYPQGPLKGLCPTVSIGDSCHKGDRF